MGYKIVRNRWQCRACLDIIESKHCHDFVRCKCGKIFADGGKDYLRRGGDMNSIIDACELIEDSGDVNKVQLLMG